MVETLKCPVCNNGEYAHYVTIEGYNYFDCPACESIFIDPLVLDKIDSGEAPFQYNES